MNPNDPIAISTPRTDHYTMGLENDIAILKTEPDVITRQPITSQSSVTLYCVGPWSYTPSGPPPLERQNFHGSTASIHSDCKSRSPSETKENVSVSAPSGSRDWSRNLYDSFKYIRQAKHKCSAIYDLCCECFRVPCMMRDVALSLGDKGYLPFVPGTGAAIRFKVRILGGIQGSIGDDCVVTTCCCPCAACQMYKEIEDIGLGPS